MAKKPVLKHAQPNGDIATRQTNRPYTHVLLQLHNGPALIAAAIAALPSNLKSAKREAQDFHDHHSNMVNRGVGGMYPAHKDFPYWRITQDNFNESESWLKTYPTAGDYITKRVDDVQTAHAHRVDGLRLGTFDWEVISWHSRAELARPDYIAPGASFRVEAINGGARS